MTCREQIKTVCGKSGQMWKLNYMEELEQICSGDGFLPGFLAHDRTGSCADRPVSRYLSKPEQLPVIQKTTVSNAGLVERWVDMLIRIMNFFMLTSW